MPYFPPGRADFGELRHMVLLYRNPGRPWTAADLVPYVAHLDASGRPDAWLFDSFLFLAPAARSGRHYCADVNLGTTMCGEGDFFAACSPTPADRADAEDLLDHFLGDAGAARALDAAVQQVARLLGAPPRPRNAVFMIPYPHVTQAAWGALDSGGRVLDFTTRGHNLQRATEDRLAASAWYVDEVARRFRAAGHRHVALLGVYWMFESVHRSWECDDHWLLKELRPRIHAHGLKHLWIPFWSTYNVHQLDDYERYYFDLAFLQPNAMFYRHGKTVAQAAQAARARHAGIEMEYYLSLDEPIAVGAERHQRFAEYLRGGVEFGYQHAAACAWFVGMDTFPLLRTHADPAERQVYEDIHRFVQGRYTAPAGAAPARPQEADGRLALAADLGGTQLRFALVDATGTVQARSARGTPGSPEAIVAALRDGLGTLAARARGPRLAGAGVSTGGRVDHERGIVLDSTALLPGWRDVPLGALLAETLGPAVRIDNDGHCATLAEHRLGSGRGASHFAHLVLGTGLGGGIVADDRLVRGAANGAGEVGHLSVDPGGPRCSCGNLGCAELWASGAGLRRAAKEAGLHAEPEALVRMAEAGDGEAIFVLHQAGRRLGLLLVHLLHALQPERIALGGPVYRASAHLRRGAEAVVAERAMPLYRERCAIVDATVVDAGLVGAALLVL
ncbi:MAG: ROK family protein [Planctomycetes bacterium]|nr:ROK family protein [Planctomycetota bacterium]